MQFLPFSIELIYLFLALIALLSLSALISGCETAIFSLSPSDLSALEQEQSKGAKATINLLKDQDKLLSTILIFNNLVNIAAIIVAGSIIDKSTLFSSATVEFIVKIVAVTFVLLLFGEIMPKILATYRSRGFARRMAPSLQILSTVLSPLSWILIRCSSMITRWMSTHSEGVSMGKLQAAIEIAESETPEDKKMLSGIVRFSGTEVVEIMKPRIDVVAIDKESDFDHIKQVINGSGFSRLPVYDESFDKILGILFIKDLLPYLDEKADFDWLKLLREPYFVPENKKINDLLEDFQAKHQHLCIVVDEYGGTLGIATLEDILEEIVGDIADESDSLSTLYHEVSPGVYEFEGSTHLVDFVRAMDVNEAIIDKEKGDADTLAGLMIELRGDFFKVGEKIRIGRLTLTASGVEGYRITKVLVRRDIL